jgi:DNA-binding NarL/FixJ family response regulator
MPTIVIIDDHKIIRDALRALLKHTPGMSVIGEAADGRAGVELVLEKKPEVVLLDFGLPLLNGMEVTHQLRDRGYRGGIVIISMHTEGHLVLGTRKAGADAYVLKEYAFEQILFAIDAAQRHEFYQSPQLNLEKATLGLIEELTPREREVLQLLAEGATPKSVAYTLKISSKTVDVHSANLRRKLNASTLAELTRIALRAGITQL